MMMKGLRLFVLLLAVFAAAAAARAPPADEERAAAAAESDGAPADTSRAAAVAKTFGDLELLPPRATRVDERLNPFHRGRLVISRVSAGLTVPAAIFRKHLHVVFEYDSQRLETDALATRSRVEFEGPFELSLSTLAPPAIRSFARVSLYVNKLGETLVGSVAVPGPGEGALANGAEPVTVSHNFKRRLARDYTLTFTYQYVLDEDEKGSEGEEEEKEEMEEEKEEVQQQQQQQQLEARTKAKTKRPQRKTPKPQEAADMLLEVQSSASFAETRDMSLRFEAIVDVYRSRDKEQYVSLLKPKAERFVVLLVPGLGTEYYPGYMDGNRAALRRLGMAFETSKINTLASCEANAVVLKAEVLALHAKHQKKVVLIGHSKGSVDVTEMVGLHMERAEVERAVGGFISLQGPMHGTAVAPIVQLHPDISGVYFEFLKVIGRAGATGESVTDLSVERRAPFMEAHPFPTDLVPTACLATHHDWKLDSLADLGPILTMKALGSVLTRITGHETDGMVPEMSGMLPGAAIVRDNKLDHTGGALSMPYNKYSPEEITFGMMTVLLDHVMKLRNTYE